MKQVNNDVKTMNYGATYVGISFVKKGAVEPTIDEWWSAMSIMVNDGE